MVQKILRRLEIKPFKIKYYCEKRDPEFEQKMHDVLLVYKQISLQFHEDGSIIVPEDGIVVHTVSCDEKPGIQAVATTGDGLRPTTDTGCVYRDAEYKRLGTLSLLAGIDLLTAYTYILKRPTGSRLFIIGLIKWMKSVRTRL